MSDEPIPPKSLDDSFIDWEAGAFGFGYGSGEEHVMGALKAFLMAIPEPGRYDYQNLEQAVTAPVAWLLINRLCSESMIEYGTSPRYGWLTARGRLLRAYLISKALTEILNVLGYDHEQNICSRDSCNCGPTGYVEGRSCPNPFWREKLAPSALAELTTHGEPA